MNLPIGCHFALGLLLLSGCAIAPAGVSRTGKLVSTDAHALLRQAMAEPETAAGKLALGHFIEKVKKSETVDRGEVVIQPANGGAACRVRFSSRGYGTYALGDFDEISPATDFAVKKLPRHTREGAGTPMLALTENRHREPIEKYFPPEAIARPLTAVLHSERNGSGVRIDLMCPLVHDSVRLAGQEVPLAADFTVSWAAALARTGKLNQSRVLDMITPSPRREPRLFLMEPYDPRKEPLIMIHGLLSTPLAWSMLSNDLWADPAIRKRYQIWHYLYNTSAPALYSTRILRTQLKELRQLLDPENDDPAMRHTTLLTHSMGGLVGKALAMEPGDVFWKAAFNGPHQQLKLTAEDRILLDDAFEWKADRTVRRIIFVCTPHRGSAFADNAIGRVGAWLTKPPNRFREFYVRVAAANPGAFTAAYAALGTGELDSVHSLSPQQPTLHILDRLPYARPVMIHSIIGNRGLPVPLEQSSDGIVPYTSSHLEKVASEKIVPAGHGAFRHPEAVQEIKRVLRL